MTAKTYSDITYQIGTSHGYPVMETMTVKQQKEIEQTGFTVQEVIDEYISSYKDWQCDC